MAAHDDLSPTGYVVLGMLRLGVRTGYDIKQLVDKSTRFFWAASYGQIYPELKKLEEAGLIKGASDPQGGRRRRAYDLTAKGERALDAWLRSPDTPPVETRDSALLKLFFHDLRELNQLYRVGALLVVAVVAILASVLYQRFSPSDDRTTPPQV